ncbi:MAG: hypothetical protein FRX49_03865 [Trebouxia sp. A1-2]|nr:MAG: hypothetical protein FRX49_11015 [Trebouxia sp. A1-2]KAA6426013.1 MAG: hypothetical protein FRX49_03865 [Trebouxia sp. A1-2]
MPVQAEEKRQAKMQKLLGSRDALRHRIHNHLQQQAAALQEIDSKQKQQVAKQERLQRFNQHVEELKISLRQMNAKKQAVKQAEDRQKALLNKADCTSGAFLEASSSRPPLVTRHAPNHQLPAQPSLDQQQPELHHQGSQKWGVTSCDFLDSLSSRAASATPQVVKARVLDAKQTALEKKVSWLLLLQWGTLLLAAATGDTHVQLALETVLRGVLWLRCAARDNNAVVLCSSGLPDTEGVPPGAPVPTFVSLSPESGGSFAQGLPQSAPAPAAAPAPAPPAVPSFDTSCVIDLAGAPGGTTLASASIVCQGPGVPVPLLGSTSLAAYSSKFQGITFTQDTDPDDDGLVLSFADLPGNVAVQDSQFTSLPGFVIVSNSTVRFSNVTFSQCNTNGPGAMDIKNGAAVFIQNSTFVNNTGAKRRGNCETQQDTDLLAAIQGSNFTGNSAANSQGGALVVSGNSTSILSSSTFQSNFAARGAGIYIVNSSLIVEATNFTFNAARSAGGAIFVDSGSQSNITGSFFSFNTAGQSSGAVSQADSSSVIDTCQFNSNSGSTQGGALFQNNMTGSVTSCTFLNNSGATGAGMYQNIGNINVTGVLFDSNIATGSGGGLFQNSFAGSVQNCTFTNNRVGGSGGGLFQNNYRGNVATCVFNTNSARSGGAIYQNAATGMTSDSTFTGNGAEKGGAIYQNNCQDANIVNCTFNNNTAQQGPVLFLNSSLPNISGSTFNGSTSAANQVFNNAASPSPGAAEGTPSTGGSSSPEAPATSSAAEHTPAGGGSINVGK